MGQAYSSAGGASCPYRSGIKDTNASTLSGARSTSCSRDRRSAARAESLRSLWKLQHVPPGFDATNVLTAEVFLPQQRYRDREAQLAFWHSLTDKLHAINGASDDGFRITVLPVTIAAEVIPAMIASGKFHGGITAPAPRGM